MLAIQFEALTRLDSLPVADCAMSTRLSLRFCSLGVFALIFWFSYVLAFDSGAVTPTENENCHEGDSANEKRDERRIPITIAFAPAQQVDREKHRNAGADRGERFRRSSAPRVERCNYGHEQAHAQKRIEDAQRPDDRLEPHGDQYAEHPADDCR